MREPLLRTRLFTEGGTDYKMNVHGGLHYIKGNRAPYFSLTADVYRKAGNGRWVEDSFGCQHELILRYYPVLKDLADLHLSSMDGAPMHALENGWYWLGGSKYQGFDAEKVASHFRITEVEAKELHMQFMPSDSTLKRHAKKAFALWVKAKVVDWQAEAEACIAKHDLKIYGDAYATP